MRIAHALTLAIFAAVLPAPLSAADDLSIEHQGVARHYLMHLPAGPGSARPLVIWLHGLQSPDWQNNTRPEIDAAAEREGFVALYPAALQGRWNYSGQRDEKAKIGDSDADDVGFIAKLMDDLVARQIAEPRRVYVIGESRGAVMTFELMCRLADRIAAAAPLISGMLEAQRDACAPTRAVPVFAVDGTNDPIQFYDGWLLPHGRLLSVPETLEFWRREHGCSGEERELLPHRVAGDPTRILLIRWTGCAVAAVPAINKRNAAALPQQFRQTANDAVGADRGACG
jgi:polyhydroxybutyrate depolymerase